jgi:uncharacterized protein DUF6311
MKIPRFSENKITYALSFVIAALLFHISYGMAVLNPENINWLMAAHHDWGTHYLGWAFYRNDPWTFPLGTTTSYFYPSGTNAGFTDSIPLFAFVFKLFSSILPEDFQYFGIWLFLCHMLVAFYTVKIMRLYNAHMVSVLLAVVILCTNPVLIFRGMHPALCAHWLILGSLYNYLIITDKDTVRAVNRTQVFFLFASATIHPYLTAIIGGFTIIVPLKNYLYERTLSIKQLVAYPLAAFASVILFWILFGLIEFSDGTNLDAGGVYSMYSMNLDTFFNSFGFYSKYMPSLGMVSDRQHEGFAYLGLGILLLAVAAFGIAAIKWITVKGFSKRLKPYTPFAVLCVLLLIFAASDKVSWRTAIIFEYPTLGIIEKFGNIFRAIGRFVWPVYYGIFLFAMLVFLKLKMNRWLQMALFCGVAGLQVYDTQNLILAHQLPEGPAYKTPQLEDKKWETIFGHFGEVITYPPYANDLVYSMDYQDISFLAMKAGKPVSNGYVARENTLKSQAFKDTVNAEIQRGEIAPERVYVTAPKYIDNFRALIYKDKVSIQELNGFIFIYPKAQKINSLFTETARSRKYFDSIAASYRSKGTLKPLGFVVSDAHPVVYNVEGFSFNENVVQVNGWAFPKETDDDKGDSVFIALTNTKRQSFVAAATIVHRGDLTEVYKKQYLDDAGFNATIFTDKLPKDTYAVGILIKDKKGVFHYVKTERICEVGKNKFKAVVALPKLPSEGVLLSNLEKTNVTANWIGLSGWAALNDKDSYSNKVDLVLSGNGKQYVLETDAVNRTDVTDYFQKKFNYDNSGFATKFKRKNLPKGTYRIGVIITDTKLNKSVFKLFDKSITVSN